jgi:hypothetical protein
VLVLEPAALVDIAAQLEQRARIAANGGKVPQELLD